MFVQFYSFYFDIGLNKINLCAERVNAMHFPKELL